MRHPDFPDGERRSHFTGAPMHLLRLPMKQLSNFQQQMMRRLILRLSKNIIYFAVIYVSIRVDDITAVSGGSAFQ